MNLAKPAIIRPDHNNLFNSDDLNSHHQNPGVKLDIDTTKMLTPLEYYEWDIALGATYETAILSLCGKDATYFGETNDFWGVYVTCYQSGSQDYNILGYYVMQPINAPVAKVAYGSCKNPVSLSRYGVFGDYIALQNAWLDGETLTLAFQNFFGGGSKQLKCRVLATLK